MWRAPSGPVNDDGAEVVHVGVGRAGKQQIPQGFEETGGIVVGKKGGGIEAERLGPRHRIAVDQGAGRVGCRAGAVIDGETVARAQALGLDPAAFLDNNDSTAFFEALGDLLVPGPTYTNVNDFRAIVVDRP